MKYVFGSPPKYNNKIERPLLYIQRKHQLAIRSSLITGAFNAISAQAFHAEGYLTLIHLERDKKINQRAICLSSGLLYYTFTQMQSPNSRQILIPLEILEKYNTKLFENNIYKLEGKLAYRVTAWSHPLAIIITNTKKMTTQLNNLYLTSKPSLEIVAYLDGSGINKKIGFFT